MGIGLYAKKRASGEAMTGRTLHLDPVIGLVNGLFIQPVPDNQVFSTPRLDLSNKVSLAAQVEQSVATIKRENNWRAIRNVVHVALASTAGENQFSSSGIVMQTDVQG